MRVHYLQHVWFETPGCILDWARDRGYKLTSTLLYESAQFPEIDSFDLLVIMGGPMSVHDLKDYSWLAQEKEFIKKCIRHGKMLFGICLGAQLLAETCGGRVQKNPEKEIGFFPVKLSLQAIRHPFFEGIPEVSDFFHWHGETFSLPEGAIAIGSSEACLNQGFLLNNQILALQFHPEVTSELVTSMVKEGLGELKPSRFVQSAEAIRSALKMPSKTSHFPLFGILDRFTGLRLAVSA
jgi:GMP synthase-like glutamine amidotransferase